tara:strand:- start:716 stop:1849 length:1134 start_codon:yes stop_codon:yes gene_type:complete
LNSKNKKKIDNQLRSYDYELDPSLIAYEPKKVRHTSRMMIVRDFLSENSESTDKLTEHIVDELSKDDLIIINDTKVMKARLSFLLENSSLVEGLVLEPVEDSIWLCLAKPAKKLKKGIFCKLNSNNRNEIQLEIIGIDRKTGGRFIKFPKEYNNLYSMNKLLDIHGKVPLPPYIKRIDKTVSHESLYQTQYAKNPGAVAAPTAGLHLSTKIIKAIKNKGIKILPITLHVGYGTFKPIDQENLEDLKLHQEFVHVSPNVIKEIKYAKKQGKKVIAIGTTSVRALESCYCTNAKEIIPISKNVDLVIKPGFKFKVVDGLLTNFHLPKSSLLLLVSAMIGRERMLDLYKKAIREKFRFFSYGDAMFISPDSVLEDSKFKT